MKGEALSHNQRRVFLSLPLQILAAIGAAPAFFAQAAPISGGSATEVVYSTDRAQLDDVRDFYYRVFGRDEFSLLWSELERFKSGAAIPERKPYLDSWYPQSKGGTDIGGALKRYDKAFYNSQAKAALWEATQHSGGAAWAGHCDGTSAASIRYQNPRLEVRRPAGCDPANTSGCTVFSPSDIRALLTEISMNAKAKFLAGERCEKRAADFGQEPFPRSQPERMDACGDANPASFHAGVINFLGRMKQPLIFDFTAAQEVWNFPIYSYSYQASATLTPAQAMTEMGLSGSNWIFNPAASVLRKITMTLHYRESQFDLNGAGTVPSELNSKTYTYILEFDAQEKLVGGEWSGGSRLDHPDFLWMPFEPAPPTGDPRSGNPHLSNIEVQKLWAESVGLDPESPFQDKPDNPYDVRFWPLSKDVTAWGQVVGYYRLVLDGRTNGAIFRGKRTLLRVEGSQALGSDGSVELSVNGTPLAKTQMREGFADFTFDLPEGVSILSLRWTHPRITSTELDRDFRVYGM